MPGFVTSWYAYAPIALLTLILTVQIGFFTWVVGKVPILGELSSWSNWFTSNLYPYVVQAAGLINCVVVVDVFVGALATTVTSYFTAVALRGCFWVYHQFHGSN